MAFFENTHFWEFCSYFSSKACDLKRMLEKENIAEKDCFLTGYDLWKHFFPENIFGINMIHSLYFGGKRSQVPQHIIRFYRNIINGAPHNISLAINHIFQKTIENFGWEKDLRSFFSSRFADDGKFKVIRVIDYSIGAGVYYVTFFLEKSKREISLFIKREFENGFSLKNECFYHKIQIELFNKAFVHPRPAYFEKDHASSLLLCEKFPGLSLASFFNSWLQNKKPIPSNLLEKILILLAKHSAMGDVFGRNDRHLGNSSIAWTVRRDNEQYSQVKKHADFMELLHCIESFDNIWMIDFDIQYLWDEDNQDWIIEDIKQGISELNLFFLYFSDFLDPFQDQWINKFFNFFYQHYFLVLEEMKDVSSLTILKDIFYQFGFFNKEEKFLKTIDFLSSELWLKKHSHAFLVDYRYRLLLKHLIVKQKRRVHIPTPIKQYHSTEQNVSAYLESFRGVYEEKFIKRYGLRDRLSLENLEYQIRDFCTAEDWVDVVNKKNLFEDQYNRFLSYSEREGMSFLVGGSAK